VANKANVSLLRIETASHPEASHSRRTTVVFDYSVLPTLARLDREDLALKMEV
jgi:hypothetical protein